MMHQAPLGRMEDLIAIEGNFGNRRAYLTRCLMFVASTIGIFSPAGIMRRSQDRTNETYQQFYLLALYYTACCIYYYRKAILKY